MSNLSTWLGILPITAAMLAVWIATTYFWLRLAGFRPFVAAAASPAATGAVILVFSYVYYWQGWFWSGKRVIPVLLAFGVLGGLFFWITKCWYWRETASNQQLSSQRLRELTSPVSPAEQQKTSENLLHKTNGCQRKADRRRKRKNASRPTWFTLPSIANPSVIRHLPSTPWWLGAVLVGWILAVLPTMLAGDSNNPVQQWDPSAHMNGLWGITQRGIAAPGYGLEHNYGGRTETGYPIGWYAFTSLFATQYTVVQAANASTLALMAVWVVGVGAFAAVLFGGRGAVLFSTIAAGCMLNMPADNLTAYSQWPNAQAVAFLPGTAVVAVLAGRAFLAKMRDQNRDCIHNCNLNPSWNKQTDTGNSASLPASTRTQQRIFPGGFFKSVLPLIPAAIVVLACTIGGIQAHQVMAFNMVVLLLPALLAGAGRVAKLAIERRRYLVLLLEVWAFVAGCMVLWLVMTSETLYYMSQYPRSGQSWSTAIANLFTPTPPFEITVGLVTWVAVMAILYCLALICALASRTNTGRTLLLLPRKSLGWPLFSAAFFMFLVLIVLGPTSDFRAFITAPWYLDYRRLLGPYNLVIAVFMGYGFTVVCRWINAWRANRQLVVNSRARTISAVCVSLLIGFFTFGGAIDSRIIAAQSVLDPDNLGRAGMASSEELEMLRSLDDILEEGAVVLGDPQNGSVYAQVLGQRWAYFPQLTFTNRSWTNRQILVYGFNQIHTNPLICEVLNSESIKYYYEDEDGYYYSQLRSDRAPGLYNVDTSTGFELVAEGGTAKVWRITACDNLEDDGSEENTE